MNIGMQEDWDELIQGCVEANRVCQEKLYKKLYPKMMAMVRRYTNNNEFDVAEEILNTGMLKVFQKIETYKFEGSFEGWVRKIIFHSVADYMRKNMNYKQKTLFVEKEVAIEKDALAGMNYSNLVNIIQQLPDTMRTVFNMFALDGFSHKEIADELTISEGTSKWYLFEARKILKDKIEKLK